MLREIEGAREQLARRMGTAEHVELASRLASVGIPLADCLAAVGRITEDNRDDNGRLTAMRARLGVEGDGATRFHQFLLLQAALRALDRLEAQPVPAKVKRLSARLFCQWATTPPWLGSGNEFVAFSKIATLRRLPGGLFDWETSGLPRSWIPRIRPFPQLLQTLKLVGQPVKPYRPVFFAHLTVCYPVRALVRNDALKSYHLMARSLELQPEVKALVTASWFHSPDTHRISPHLSWLNEVFLQHGGIVGTIGKTGPESGVFNRSPERQQAFEQGRFTPTEGLVIWPRDAMIAWARQHPELEAA